MSRVTALQCPRKQLSAFSSRLPVGVNVLVGTQLQPCCSQPKIALQVLTCQSPKFSSVKAVISCNGSHLWAFGFLRESLLFLLSHSSGSALPGKCHAEEAFCAAVYSLGLPVSKKRLLKRDRNVLSKLMSELLHCVAWAMAMTWQNNIPLHLAPKFPR